MECRHGTTVVGSFRQFLSRYGSSTDGSLLFLKLNPGSVDVWKLTRGACNELAQSLDIPLSYWGNVDLSPEGRIVAFSSQECLELWDAKSLRRLWAQRFGDCKARFDSEGRLILSCKQGLFRFARHVITMPAFEWRIPWFEDPDENCRPL